MFNVQCFHTEFEIYGGGSLLSTALFSWIIFKCIFIASELCVQYRAIIFKFILDFLRRTVAVIVLQQLWYQDFILNCVYWAIFFILYCFEEVLQMWLALLCWILCTDYFELCLLLLYFWWSSTAVVLQLWWSKVVQQLWYQDSRQLFNLNCVYWAIFVGIFVFFIFLMKYCNCDVIGFIYWWFLLMILNHVYWASSDVKWFFGFITVNCVNLILDVNYACSNLRFFTGSPLKQDSPWYRMVVLIFSLV